jgi:putative transposase
MARNVTDVDDGFLRGKQYLILDRDAEYSDEFPYVLLREGVHVVRLPPRSPNLNAFAERFVRSIKEECLSRLIFFGQASLRHAISRFMTHYHDERNHQAPENRLLRLLRAVGESRARVKRRQRLGSIWPACEAPGHEKSTRNDCAGDSRGVLERGGE